MSTATFYTATASSRPLPARPVGTPRACPSPCFSDNTPSRLFVLCSNSIFLFEVGQGPPPPSALCPCRERTLRRLTVHLLLRFAVGRGRLAHHSQVAHSCSRVNNRLTPPPSNFFRLYVAQCVAILTDNFFFLTVNGSRPSRLSPRVP